MTEQKPKVRQSLDNLIGQSGQGPQDTDAHGTSSAEEPAVDPYEGLTDQEIRIMRFRALLMQQAGRSRDEDDKKDDSGRKKAKPKRPPARAKPARPKAQKAQPANGRVQSHPTAPTVDDRDQPDQDTTPIFEEDEDEDANETPESYYWRAGQFARDNPLLAHLLGLSPQFGQPSDHMPTGWPSDVKLQINPQTITPEQARQLRQLDIDVDDPEDNIPILQDGNPDEAGEQETDGDLYIPLNIGGRTVYARFEPDADGVTSGRVLPEGMPAGPATEDSAAGEAVAYDFIDKCWTSQAQRDANLTMLMSIMENPFLNMAFNGNSPFAGNEMLQERLQGILRSVRADLEMLYRGEISYDDLMDLNNDRMNALISEFSTGPAKGAAQRQYLAIALASVAASLTSAISVMAWRFSVNQEREQPSEQTA